MTLLETRANLTPKVVDMRILMSVVALNSAQEFAVCVPTLQSPSQPLTYPLMNTAVSPEPQWAQPAIWFVMAVSYPWQR